MKKTTKKNRGFTQIVDFGDVMFKKQNRLKASPKFTTGFTLIETIVYIALFGILVAGVFVGAFNIIESGGKNQVKIIMKEEGDFLLSKINWAISTEGTADIISDKELQVGELKFKFDDTKKILTLSRNGGEEIQLNNSSIIVSKVTFNPIYIENQGKGIVYKIVLDSKAPNGMSITSYFDSVSYLRK